MQEVAELLGITVNTVKSYALKADRARAARGDSRDGDEADTLFPEPDAIIGQHRGWTRQTIKDWNFNRPRPSRREPDPSMLKNRRDRRAKR